MRFVAQSELHDFQREAVTPGLVGGDGDGALLHLAAGRLIGAEDAGLARGVLRGALLARAVAAGQLRGDAELPEAERLLCLETYPRRGHQVVILVLGVGGGVLDQLVPQGRLVGLDGLGVLPGEVNRKVVGGVGAGDRYHSALVHLLGEALGDLHRVDLAPERPSKDALDQRLHPLFDVFEETQKTYSPTLVARYLSTPYIIAARQSEIISEASVPGAALEETRSAYPTAPTTTAAARPTKGLPIHSASETIPASAAQSKIRSGNLGKYCRYPWA